MYLTGRFYIAAALIVLLISGGYFWAPLFPVGQALLVLYLFAVCIDAFLLWSRRGITAVRHTTERFSNGDDNPVRIEIENTYSFTVSLSVTDEIPVIFQRRDIDFRLSLLRGETKMIEYSLRPAVRGEYNFGFVRVFAMSRMGLVQRRFTCDMPVTVKVYPSYLMLHRYELLAMSNNLTEFGIKKIRRIGHHTEFEQIKEYVKGDDYRTINWKASARRHQLMVNVYQDERSQQIFNVIDKGRMMQQAFQGMTLLDYAINASLVLSYIAIRKDDKAGLVTFNEKFDTFLPASKSSNQMHLLLDALYNQTTTFGETDFSALCVHLAKNLHKRSFLVLYTNFDNLGSMQRQLPYLIQLNSQHRLLVVFFEDADLVKLINTPARSTEGYYQQVIAEKFAFEKRLIVNTLKQYGIYSLLTAPENLSVDVINKYLEMKSRQLL